jgi:CTP synthase (UTP-ammonia lyase)
MTPPQALVQRPSDIFTNAYAAEVIRIPPLFTIWPQQRRTAGGLGGTMRLGAYGAVLQRGSAVEHIYGKPAGVGERPPNRWEGLPLPGAVEVD